MKNIKKLLLLLLSLSLAFSLFSCSLFGGNDEEACEHYDDDEDGYCDECDEELEYDECESHEDEDEDGYCDNCDEKMTESSSGDEVILIEDDYVNFQIVYADGLSREVYQIINHNIKNVLINDYDVDISVVKDGSEDDEEEEIEVLIGDIRSRGDEYFVDQHTLGKKGYVIKVVGTKVIINAGDESLLIDAINEFADDILMLGEGYLEDVTMSSDDSIIEIQDDYNITALVIDGVDMMNYTIAVDKNNEYLYGGALTFQDSIYSRTGYWFEIVDLSDADDESVVFKTKKKEYGASDSFAIYTEGSQLIVECAFENMCERAVTKFITAEILSAPEGEFVFEGEMYNQDISFVTYEDFGAIGDGETDDFQAIYDTHVFANISGQIVKAKDKAIYRIFETKATIPIRTNVNWGKAEFVIDDRELGLYKDDKYYGMAGIAVFTVLPDAGYEEILIDDYEILSKIANDGLNPTTEYIDLKLDGWDGSLMLIPYNTSHKVYRRKGYSSFMGLETHEVVVIDENGKVSDDTPLMFDYPNVNRMKVYKLDKSTAITIDGGIFTTRACQKNIIDYNSETGRYYYREGTPALSRNINVQRSYTLVKNVQHFVTDELTIPEQFADNGDICKGLAPYYGFFTADYASDVTFENCVLTGRRCYPRPPKTLSKGAGTSGTGGTYDIYLDNSNMIRFVNCEQQNFWITIDPTDYSIVTATENTDGAIPNMAFVTYGKYDTAIQVYWGIGGTNYCKNVQYIGSTLTRYDAHAGLYNGLIKDSTVTGIALTGNGKMIVENSRYFAPKDTSTYNTLIYLRSDYGSTWAGDIEVKDVTAYMYTKNSTRPLTKGDYSGLFISGHEYVNWYYGYMAKMPNISIENLDLYDVETKEPIPEGFEVIFNRIEQKEDKNIGRPYIAPNQNKMHLKESHFKPVIPIYDGNKDGFIDELPFDIDGDGVVDAPIDIGRDGVVGETKLKYKDIWDAKYAEGKHESGVELNTYTNLNIIQPPKYFKILKNDGVDTNGDGVADSGGYKYLVAKTHGGGISNGGWYGIEENLGGFYGSTTFIFGEGENDFVIGTANPDGKDTKAFYFVETTLR